jgi:Carboxypeptidase regulatory-like domain
VSARTDSNGSYTFSGIDAGAYSISISRQGFRTSTLSQVNLRPGYNSNINATLNVGMASETIENIGRKHNAEQYSYGSSAGCQRCGGR